MLGNIVISNIPFDVWRPFLRGTDTATIAEEVRYWFKRPFSKEEVVEALKSCKRIEILGSKYFSSCLLSKLLECCVC